MEKNSSLTYEVVTLENIEVSYQIQKRYGRLRQTKSFFK